MLEEELIKEIASIIEPDDDLGFARGIAERKASQILDLVKKRIDAQKGLNKQISILSEDTLKTIVSSLPPLLPLPPLPSETLGISTSLLTFINW